MSELLEIEQRLWNKGSPEDYNPAHYAEHTLEQYKICLQLANNISARRGNANTFFLSFNTALVGALAALMNEVSKEAAFALFAAAILFSVTWALLLRSYRSLNTAKFKVIGLLEKRLPASPIWAAEWKALGEGSDWRKHIPLSPIETLVPAGFLILYVYLAYLKFTS